MNTILGRTIEIKGNGDIYINGKEATTGECEDLP